MKFLPPLAALLLITLPTRALEPLGIALESYSYPYPVQFLPLTLEGQELRMAYMDIPAQKEREPKGVVTLLHGKNFGGYYFAPVIQSLTSAGYRVIVPDQIGWGKSSKPDLHYTFDLLAENTAKLLDHLNIKQSIILGHSTGGMLAVRFTRTYPDRVPRLILEDPVGLEDYRFSIPPQSTQTLYQAELNLTPEKVSAVFKNYFVSKDPSLSTPLAEVPLRVLLSAEYPRWAKASALAYQMIYQQPVRHEYKLLKPPTLLIVGQQDRTAVLKQYADPETAKTLGNYPALAQAAAKEIPACTLSIIPECGHIPHLEKPQEFTRALMEFLK